ncbi:hypothetical protein [Lentzea sp. NPDC004782]|uniref:tetratricopeptide repeat protein n=1 Tax=Lentzea sp. NPDC004782 TaxID=3154458 RepID=UPI0033B5E8FA
MSGDPNAGSAGSVDPATVQTLSELASALQRLRGSRSYADLDKAINPNHGREAPRLLPPSTLNNLLRGKSAPIRQTVTRFLTACGVEGDAQAPWTAAWERATTAHLRRPIGAVRVREARPRLLGVHASIQVDGAEGELPTYVPRDFDPELRAAINAAAEHGGLVLLVGSSSVGKTRAMFEAVCAVLPEWWLIHPDAADIEPFRALADAPLPRTVVWFDELQRYLDSSHGVPAGLVRRLVAAGTVLVATLWPHEYAGRTLVRAPGRPDLHANDRELLGVANVIHVSDDFSPAERRRAETVAGDRRIRVALDTPDTGFTQVIAAGPQLIHHREHAPAEQCYGKAVITAALDARRVGARAAITRDYLAAAAPAYLNPVQQATAPKGWFLHAISYAITRLNGATSALTPVPAGMRQIAGYEVADYLYQYAGRVRRTTHLPDTAWQALVEHHDPGDALLLAKNAARRGRNGSAEALYRQAMDCGNSSAATYLARLLAKQGHIDDAMAVLRPYAYAGDGYATFYFVPLLIEQGRLEELPQLGNARAAHAAVQFAGVGADQGLIEEALAMLQPLVDTGEAQAAEGSAHLRADDNQGDQPSSTLHPLADTNDYSAARREVYALAALDRIGELAQRFEAGDWLAGERLADLLIKHDQTDQALDVLRQLADAGDDSAGERLVNLLVVHSRIDELEAEVAAGTAHAVETLWRCTVS